MALALRQEEGIGLGLAVAAHVALVAFLVLYAPRKPVVVPPERMTVSLSEDVGLTATSPDAGAQPAPDAGPEIGEAPPPPAPIASPEPAPPPVPKVQPPRPAPVRAPQPRPLPKAIPAPRPVARATPTPPRPQQAARPVQQRPAQQARPTQQRPTAGNPGSSRFADAFKQGVPGAQGADTSRTTAAAAIGPAERSSLINAISRAIKPRWVAPQGVEADRLVTYVTWSLNPDGSLAGAPRVTRQEGITDANRPQAARHAEQAIRAIQLANFDLPPQYYTAWKRVVDFRFDRKLSQ